MSKIPRKKTKGWNEERSAVGIRNPWNLHEMREIKEREEKLRKTKTLSLQEKNADGE